MALSSISQALALAFDRITTWMNAHGAAVLVENLAPGATAAGLADVERKLGFPIHPELRALWELHDGQRDELNGFVGAFDLFSSQRAITDDAVGNALGYLRDGASDVARTASGATAEELASDAWIQFAGRDSDGLAIQVETGRVFEVTHDDSPPLALCAPSLVAWLTSYADAVTNDHFRVEEGFGDCYLERRNRAAEARDAERQRVAAEEAQRHAAMTPEALIDETVARNRASAARDVIDHARAESPAALARVISHLFGAASASPSFIAEALRAMLHQLTLTSSQWLTVSEGGARLGNNAIRDVALARSRAS